MNTHQQSWRFIGILGLILVVTMACALPFGTPEGSKVTVTPQPEVLVTLVILPTGTPTPTLTPAPGPGAGSGTGGSSSGGSSGGGSSGGSGGGSSGGGSGGGNGDNGGDTPTRLPDISSGPYVVKQIETLGGESISGVVCSLAQPFSVLSATPKVTFTFLFVPQDAGHGKVSYAYQIKSAGESHDASGTYQVAPVDQQTGTLQVSLAVSDHVVFKGFDGNIPNRYKFNLVPNPGSPCK